MFLERTGVWKVSQFEQLLRILVTDDSQDGLGFITLV